MEKITGEEITEKSNKFTQKLAEAFTVTSYFSRVEIIENKTHSQNEYFNDCTTNDVC